MSNNIQSSVEWSIDQMIALCEDYDDGKINYTDYINGVKEVKSQAKEKHKEEIVDAASDHCYPTYELAKIDAEEYYNKTYKLK